MIRYAFVILFLWIACASLGGCQSGQAGDKNLPVAIIDSMSSEKASAGEKIAMAGHGIPVSGTITAYVWRSDKDGDINILPSFETSKLSSGVHTIYFKVQDTTGAWSKEAQKKLTIGGSTQAGPVIEYFKATPSNIEPGGSSTLSWNVTGATQVLLNNEAGSIGLSGNRVVSPGVTTVYTLNAINNTGSTKATVQVEVPATFSADSPPVINYFGADPDRIVVGETAVLRWDIVNASNVTIQPGIGKVTQAGKKSLSPSSTTSYQLIASNSNGTVTATIPITVLTTKPFNVTKVVITEGPASCDCPCPVKMEYVGAITTNGPCVVTYLWEQSDGAKGPTNSMTFYGADTLTVNYTWTATNNGNYGVRLRTLTPNEMVTTNFSAIITCKKLVIKNIESKGSTGAGVSACPVAVSFSADITVDAKGTVTYRWEQSDGGVSKDMTATFAAAGTQTLTYSWNVNKSGTYWARLRTLTPVVMTSLSYASVVVNCEYPVTEVKVTDATASGRPCPSMVTFSGSIKMSGPGQVSYYWLLSDGQITPSRTLTFSAASTQFVNQSWEVSSSGTYSAILSTVTPTALSSDGGATVNVMCEY